MPAALLRLLLFLAGDVEINPGPIYHCCNCSKIIRRSQSSVLCQSGSWCHSVKLCSGLNSIANYSQPFNFRRCAAPPAVQTPGATVPTPSTQVFKVLQLNICGLASKVGELLKFMGDRDIRLAALQETLLSDRSRVPFHPRLHAAA